MIPIYKISLPEYNFHNKPNFDEIGNKIDSVLKEKYLGMDILVRVLGSQEHPGKTVDDLIEIIKTNGTDRYDASREGDRYKNIENKHIDFFAMPFSITSRGEYFKFLLEPFYHYPSITRDASPVRIDIAIIYNPEKVEIVEHQYEGREGEIKKDGYIFKDNKNKPDAILGIICID